MGIAYHINHLRRMWTAGRFPKPFKLSARRLAWKSSDIEQWIEARVAGTSAQRND
jgi:predicted DNA-binding transcriptional regulator AlpA